MYFSLLSRCGREKKQQKANYLKIESLKISKQLERSKWDMSAKEGQG